MTPDPLSLFVAGAVVYLLGLRMGIAIGSVQGRKVEGSSDD